MRVNLTLLLTALAMFAGSYVSAQSPNASISGVVLDPDKKSIADAEILVVNDYTRVQFEAKSNAEGFFAVTNLPPGQYRIQVSKIGFKAIIKPDIILNVQDALAVNFTLPIGAASVVVTVEGGAPLINTTDGAVSTVVDRQFAENLPMNGRSFQTLVYLTPGVVATPSNSGDSGQFSVNGQRADANYWMVDGVGANIGIGATQVGGGNGLGGSLGSFSALGGTNSLVSVDALQEFRIQTSTFAPEFGRTPGGQISVVTRSGTNDFHGTLFDYLRNDVLDANNWFANSVGATKPRERQNDFGGTFNGPIVKNRAFFFFSYEGLRLRLPKTQLTTVPDLAVRSAAVAAMQPYLNAYPLPNGPDDIATGIAQFNASYSDPATLDAYSLRMDYRLNNRWTLFGRYNDSPSQLDQRGADGSSALSVVESSRIRLSTATMGLTGEVAPGITNDLRFNYSRTDARNNSQMDSFGAAVPLTTLPFPDGVDTPNGFFSLSIFSLDTGFNISSGAEAHAVQHQVNLVEGVSAQRGAHGLKFGVDYRRLSPALTPRTYQQVAIFRTIPSAALGNTSSGNVSAFTNETILFRNLGAYVQDTWRAWSRLTLTYGLRWDVDFPPGSLEGPRIPAVTGYDLTDLSNLSVAPPGTSAFHTTYGNVAPRLGLAVQISRDPHWQTVLRGGWGIFYDLINSETGNLLASTAPPFGERNFFSNQVFPFSASQVAAPPVPVEATLTTLNVFNPNVKLPYTMQWNIAVEQSLGENQVLSASYIGASGRRLLQTNVLVSPPTNPAIAQGTFVDNTGESSYNAMQIQFRRRLSGGLQALASYTFAHSIDDASAGSGFVGSDLGLPGSGDLNRGNSDFDIRHTFTAGLTYDIPMRNRGFVGKKLLGDWSTESFLLARSATPVDLTDINFFDFETGAITNVRPDVNPGNSFYLFGAQYPGGKAINPDAFLDPPADPITGAPLRQGTLPRNKLRGFGAVQWDFAVHRDFPLKERLKLQFRAELFNVLNHPNFGPPNNQFGSGAFGVSTQLLGQSLSSQNSLGGGGFDPLYQIGGPRSVQLALKLIF